MSDRPWKICTASHSSRFRFLLGSWQSTENGDRLQEMACCSAFDVALDLVLGRVRTGSPSFFYARPPPLLFRLVRVVFGGDDRMVHTAPNPEETHFLHRGRTKEHPQKCGTMKEKKVSSFHGLQEE